MSLTSTDDEIIPFSAELRAAAAAGDLHLYCDLMERAATEIVRLAGLLESRNVHDSH